MFVFVVLLSTSSFGMDIVSSELVAVVVSTASSGKIEKEDVVGFCVAYTVVKGADLAVSALWVAVLERKAWLVGIFWIDDEPITSNTNKGIIGRLQQRRRLGASFMLLLLLP